MSEEVILVKLENLEENLKEKIELIKTKLDKKADNDYVIIIDGRVSKIETGIGRVAWIIGTAILLALLTLILKDGLV